MHKDFIYIPSSKMYLNINHIIDILVTDDKILVIMSSYNNSLENVHYKFPISDIEYFKKITGDLNEPMLYFFCEETKQ